MNVQFNPNIGSIAGSGLGNKMAGAAAADNKEEFAKTIAKYLNKVNDDQQEANTSITDLLTGRSEDVNTVVAKVAKADMSFKLLVGVRNKLVEAYKETMKMPV